QSLRVSEIGVRNGCQHVEPVGGEPAAEAVRIVTGAEIVVAGFRIAFFTLEFVVLREDVNVGALAAVGVEVSIVNDLHRLSLRDCDGSSLVSSPSGEVLIGYGNQVRATHRNGRGVSEDIHRITCVQRKKTKLNAGNTVSHLGEADLLSRTE